MHRTVKWIGMKTATFIKKSNRKNATNWIEINVTKLQKVID